MKPSKFLIVTVFLISILNTSCSSDDNLKQPIDSLIEQPVNPSSQNLFSISSPRGQDMAYSGDTQEFEYDNLKRITKISFGGIVFGVIYANENLIETNLLQENISNVNLTLKSLYYIQDNKIQYILKNAISRSVDTNIFQDKERDSIQFTYVNNYISKIEEYSKFTRTVNFPAYKLEDKTEFEITNGNITRTQRTNLNIGIITSTFTYDDKPYIPMSEFAYETPYYLNNILIEKYIGSKSKNNVIRVVNVYPQIAASQKYFEVVNYSRELDQFGRLQYINLSGNTITTNPFINSSFSNKKTVFTYK